MPFKLVNSQELMYERDREGRFWQADERRYYKENRSTRSHGQMRRNPFEIV